MKILLDGSNFSLTQGTGLATYTRELSVVLSENGHLVSCLFGLDNIKPQEQVQWASFVQSLNVHGEAGSTLKSPRLLSRVFQYLFPFIFSRPIGIDRIDRKNYVSQSGVIKNIEQFSTIYNVPLLFRVAQSYSFFLRKPMQVSLPEVNEVDIFHCTSPIPVYIDGVKNIVTLHDLIPITLPHSTSVNLRHYLNIIYASIRRADAISVVSQHAKDDLIRILGIPEDKIFVTYQSSDIPASVEAIDDSELRVFLKKNYNLDINEYFLYYGAIEPKKNVSRLIRAAQSSDNDIPLVIVGKEGWLCADVMQQLELLRGQATKNRKGPRRSRVKNSVIRFPYLPREDLMMILKGARALVFPSLYEGFGLPVLEAMNVGTPVITSNVTSLPEIGGEAPIYVDPLSEREIAKAMDRLAEDKSLALEMSAIGRERAKYFSKLEYIKRLEAMYDHVCGQP